MLTCDHDGVDDVGAEGTAFRHWARDDGGRSNGEHELEAPVSKLDIGHSRRSPKCESKNVVAASECKRIAHQPERDAAHD